MVEVPLPLHLLKRDWPSSWLPLMSWRLRPRGTRPKRYRSLPTRERWILPLRWKRWGSAHRQRPRARRYRAAGRMRWSSKRIPTPASTKALSTAPRIWSREKITRSLSGAMVAALKTDTQTRRPWARSPPGDTSSWRTALRTAPVILWSWATTWAIRSPFTTTLPGLLRRTGNPAVRTTRASIRRRSLPMDFRAAE